MSQPTELINCYYRKPLTGELCRMQIEATSPHNFKAVHDFAKQSLTLPTQRILMVVPK